MADHCCLHSSLPPAACAPAPPARGSSSCSLISVSPSSPTDLFKGAFPSSLHRRESQEKICTHLVIIIVKVSLIILKILLVLILEVAVVPQCPAGKVVDRAGDDLLFEFLAELVVELELGIEVFELLLVQVCALENLLGRWLGRLEEVEERVLRDILLDSPGATGGCGSAKVKDRLDAVDIGMLKERIVGFTLDRGEGRRRSQYNGRACPLTLVPLLLDLDLLGQILVRLPLDLVSDSPVIDKVTAVPNLLLR